MFAPFAGLSAIYFASAKPAVTGGTSKITQPGAEAPKAPLGSPNRLNTAAVPSSPSDLPQSVEVGEMQDWTVLKAGCLRGGTGPLRFRRPCGSRPEGLSRRCRRPLRSRAPRTPTFRPVACRARLAWRSERPRRRRRRRCRQNSMVHSACCFSVMGQPSHFGGTLRQRCCETSDPVLLTTHQGLAHKAY